MNPKQYSEYVECRTVRQGLTVALDELPGQRSVIVAIADRIACAWEYSSITDGLAAWFAWQPEQNAEPQGFTTRIDVQSKQPVEIL